MNMSAIRKSIATVAVGFAITLGAIAPEASARTIARTEGSGGDASTTEMCPAGQYLVGFAGKNGSWVDQIQIICAPVRPDGTASDAVSYGRKFGGIGGTDQQISCPNSKFIDYVAFEFTEQLRQVKNIWAVCSTVNGPRLTKEQFSNQLADQVDVFFGSANARRKNYDGGVFQKCPAGELAIGINVNYGKHINGMGIICDKAAIPAAAPPPAPVGSAVAPARTGRVVNYGKPKATGSQSIMGIWEITTPQGKFNLTLNEIPTPPISPMAQYTGVLKGVDGSTLDGTLNGNGQKSVNNAAKIIEFTFGQPGAKNGGRGTLILNGDGSQLSGTVYDTKGQTTWTGMRK